MSDDNFTSIHPVELAQISSLKDKAKEDDHALFSPTDVIVKNGEVIGALEINSSALVFWWMHRDKSNIRDCVSAWQFYENIVRRTGAREVVVPCPKESPFYKLLHNPSAGYVELPETVVFMKQFRP